MAALDNAKYGLAYPSGCAAVTALLHLLKPGDHIVSAAKQYGGTRALFLDHVAIQGIEIDFVDSTDLKAIESAIKPNTKVFLDDFNMAILFSTSKVYIIPYLFIKFS